MVETSTFYARPYWFPVRAMRHLSDEELINFDKCTLLLNAMWEVLKHQQRLYAIQPNQEILLKIARLERIDDDALYSQSLAIQPRGKGGQKDRSNSPGPSTGGSSKR